MGVDLDHGPGYGNTLTWPTKAKYNLRPSAQPVEIQFDLDVDKFYRMFVSLMSAATPPLAPVH
jgi:hypothetical protein